jgi:hypothetical protein
MAEALLSYSTWLTQIYFRLGKVRGSALRTRQVAHCVAHQGLPRADPRPDWPLTDLPLAFARSVAGTAWVALVLSL